MEKPLRWVWVLGLIGLGLGGIYGFVASLGINCAADYVSAVPGATCYRLLGRFVSGSIFYTVVVGVVGMAIGLAIGLVVAIPVMLWRRDDQGPPRYLLENTLVWFGLQVVELAIVVPALVFWMPDPGVWPEGLRWTVAVVALVALTSANYALRRRFLPKRDPLAASAEEITVS